MAGKKRPIGAAVDVGSNSVHLLVGEIRREGLRHLRDESVLLGLGDVVDQAGRLPSANIGQLVDVLRGYTQVSRSMGAQGVTFVGTHPIRGARNSAEICRQVEQAIGLPLFVLSEVDEARLTYLGATGGRRPSEPLLVTDVGGGSTEVIVGSPDKRVWIASLPSGSARLSNGIVLNDPPTPNEFDRLRLAARSLVLELAWARVERGLFVGGTATNLARIAPLSRIGLEQAHSVLTSTPQAELIARYTVNPRRARQLPAGAALMEALLERFGLESVEVSQASLRDGAIIAAAERADSWRSSLDELIAAEKV